jgi:hypothetical protein
MDTYQLLFFFSDDVSAKDVERLGVLLSDLASQREWTLGPPRFVDETDIESATAPGDEPIRTVGGALELRRPGPTLTTDEDRRHYADVDFLVKGLAKFSATTQTELEFELGGTYVGDIVRGQISDVLTQGLLEEWRRALNRPS